MTSKLKFKDTLDIIKNISHSRFITTKGDESKIEFEDKNKKVLFSYRYTDNHYLITSKIVIPTEENYIIFSNHSFKDNRKDTNFYHIDNRKIIS